MTFPTLAKGSTHCSQLPGPFPQLGTGPYPDLARSGLWEEDPSPHRIHRDQDRAQDKHTGLGAGMW